MPIYLDTRGNSVLSVAVCDRCNRKFAYTDLQPDPNFPGMRVCKDDLDQFDPWRLPARQTENIALRHPRPDVSIGRTNSQLLTQGNLNNYAPGNSIFIDGIPPYAGAQGDLSTNGNGFNTTGNLPVPTPPNVPVVLSILPTSGSESGGTPVTITGSGFSGTTVQFGSTYADFTVINDSTIEAISPAGIFGQTVSITVTTNAGRGVGPNLFTYTAAPPTIYSVSPNTGDVAGGESVTITGFRFTGATSVTIGGTEVPSFTVVDDSHITTVTPAHGIGVVNITVTTPIGTGTGLNLFTYGTVPVGVPTIISVSPNTGYAAGGESVTITGTNFIGATSVTIGDVEVTSFTVVDAQNITTTTPAHAIGSASVTVTTASGTGTGTNLFTYTETPAYVFSVEALVVAGGGGGNRSYVPLSGPSAGGGGGGGGVIQATISLEATDYPVVVGAGGTGQYQSGQQYNSNATNGSNSSFASLVAIGGGKGGGSDYIVGNGGSGGGGGLSIGFPAPPRPPGGLGTPGQGYDGGLGGQHYGSEPPGGGGGAGAAGSGFTGGNGYLSSITGTPTYYGGGGGGAPPYGDFYPSGDGGLGGGGKGAYRDPSTLTEYNGENGTPNTGGGGGGGRYPSGSYTYRGGDGGSGIVILRYLTAAALGYEITGGTVTTDGEYTIRTFTSSETMTITPPPYSQFTSNGTYTVPEGVTQVQVLAVGRGGNGSSGDIFSSAYGGGFGGQVVEETKNVTPGEVLTITLGGASDPTYGRAPTTVVSNSWTVLALSATSAAGNAGSGGARGGAGNNGANPAAAPFGVAGTDGGIGVLSAITGEYYGGGGGGAGAANETTPYPPGVGGLGGGGTGATVGAPATSGSPNTGGGGGGGQAFAPTPGQGGTGFVAIKPI